MRTFWIVQAGIGAAGIGGAAALGMACNSTTVIAGTGPGTFTDTSAATYTDIDTDTETDTDTDTYVTQVPSCMDCACFYKSSNVPCGCADLCDNTISGATTPNACNGAPALV